MIIIPTQAVQTTCMYTVQNSTRHPSSQNQACVRSTPSLQWNHVGRGKVLQREKKRGSLPYPSSHSGVEHQ